MPTLRRELNPHSNPHLARFNPRLVTIYGTRRTGFESARTEPGQLTGFEPVVEHPVAAAVVMQDSRRQDGAATLGLLHCVNDQDVLERLVQELEHPLLERGCRRLVGPTLLSPLFGAGALTNYWNEPPPFHTPYNPPYLPDLLRGCMDPFEESTCFELPVSTELKGAQQSGKIELGPIEPAVINSEIIAPFLAEIPRFSGAAPPDQDETGFLHRWLKPWPLMGWSAEGPSGTAGVLLMQPDFGPALRAGRGGWSFWDRQVLAMARWRGATRARVLVLAVSQGLQGRGIGRALVGRAHEYARLRGWQALTFGPLPAAAPAAAFLKKIGAAPRQRYTLFKLDL
jgi:GNAT superfamily N-acetyltransferase